MKLSEIKIHPPKIELFGQYGSGKTLFAMTGGKYVQLIDMDGNLSSAISFQDKFTDIRKEVDILDCTENDPTRAIAFMKARSYIQSIADQCIKGTYPFKILVMDSQTTLTESCMRMVLSNVGKLGLQPKQPQWGLRDVELANLILLIKSLPIAVLVLAHQMTEVVSISDKEEINVVNPYMQGQKLPPVWNSKFDEIIYITNKTGAGNVREFYITNKPTNSIKVVTRSNFPDNFNVNNGLIELLKLMNYDVTK